VDNSTIVYITEIVKPSAFSFKVRETFPGRASGHVFEGRTFLDEYPIPRTQPGDRRGARPQLCRAASGLKRLELLAQEDRELATSKSYEGGNHRFAQRKESGPTSSTKKFSKSVILSISARVSALRSAVESFQMVRRREEEGEGELRDGKEDPPLRQES